MGINMLDATEVRKITEEAVRKQDEIRGHNILISVEELIMKSAKAGFYYVTYEYMNSFAKDNLEAAGYKVIQNEDGFEINWREQ